MFMPTTEFEQQLMNGLREILQLPEGWQYRDLQKMCPGGFAQFVAAVGENNIHWLTTASYEDGTQRGQLFISPQGLAIADEFFQQNIQ